MPLESEKIVGPEMTVFYESLQSERISILIGGSKLASAMRSKARNLLTLSKSDRARQEYDTVMSQRWDNDSNEQFVISKDFLKTWQSYLESNARSENQESHIKRRFFEN